jgi:hypothetical protein
MIYTHKKTGNKYRILDIVQVKVNGVWKEAVLYEPRPEYGAEKQVKAKWYVRLKEEFEARFE